MIIDCDRCTVRGAVCPRCAVTFVTEARPARARGPAAASRAAPGVGSPVVPVIRSRPASATGPEEKPRVRPVAAKPLRNAESSKVIELDAAEVRSLGALADAGLIPPLRYAPAIVKAS